MKHLINLSAVFVLSLLVISCKQAAPDIQTDQPKAETRIYKDIQLNELAGVIESTEPIILDVRTPEEYNAGHIEGAVLLDFYDEEFPDKIQSFDKSKAYVVYCQSGGRSKQATDFMYREGWTHLYNFAGGYQAYGASLAQPGE